MGEQNVELFQGAGYEVQDDWPFYNDTTEMTPASAPGDVFRIGVLDYPPSAYVCWLQGKAGEKTCPRAGFDLENLDLIARAMNMTYEFVVYQSMETGYLAPDGSWTGLLGLISNGSIDTATIGFAKTDKRRRHFEFSYPMLQNYPVFAVKRREPPFLDTAMKIFRNFDVSLWVTLMVAVVLQFILLTVIRKRDTVWRKQPQQLSRAASGSVVVADARPRSSGFVSGKILLMSLSFTVLLFLSLYQASLLGHLLHPPVVQPFDTASEMLDRIANGEYKLVARDRGHWYIEELFISDRNHFKQLRAALNHNVTVTIAEDIDDLRTLLHKGTYVAPTDIDGNVLQLLLDDCNITYVTKGLPNEWRHYLFRRGSPYITEFAKATVQKYQKSSQLFEDYFTLRPKMDECDRKVVPEGVAQLTFKALLGLFVVLLAGLLSGILFCIGEICMPICRRGA